MVKCSYEKKDICLIWLLNSEMQFECFSAKQQAMDAENNFSSSEATPTHPLLKGGYTGHEKTYSGDIDISPGLAETKRNQQILEKSDLPIFLGSSRFFLN